MEPTIAEKISEQLNIEQLEVVRYLAEYERSVGVSLFVCLGAGILAIIVCALVMCLCYKLAPRREDGRFKDVGEGMMVFAGMLSVVFVVFIPITAFHATQQCFFSKAVAVKAMYDDVVSLEKRKLGGY